MEPSSKIYGDRTEECQSSESGWTMYIGSSMDDNEDDDGGGGGGGGGGVCDSGGRKMKGVHVKNEDTDDDDDSMASDASSGPSYLQLQQPWELAQHVDEESKQCDQERCKSLRKKNKKAESKIKKDTGHEEESRKKDERLVNEKRGHVVVTTAQSGNRAWFLGKRK